MLSDGKFVSPVNPPEGYERELLTILVEECAEVQQRATKALRFGIEETQPGQPDDNAKRLAHEIGDLTEVIALAIEAGLIAQADILDGRERKRRQLAKYMQTAPTALHKEQP